MGGNVYDPWVRRAALLSVTDGDTFKLRIDLGYHTFSDHPIRLKDVNSPELDTDAGKSARENARGWFEFHRACSLDLNWPIVVRSYKDKQSFARYVGEIYCPEGHSLAEWLVAEGYAEAVS